MGKKSKKDDIYKNIKPGKKYLVSEYYKVEFDEKGNLFFDLPNLGKFVFDPYEYLLRQFIQNKLETGEIQLSNLEVPKTAPRPRRGTEDSPKNNNNTIKKLKDLTEEEIRDLIDVHLESGNFAEISKLQEELNRREK